MKKINLSMLILLLSLSFQLFAQPIESPLNSYQKIDEALAKNEINAADAAGYRVLAFFNDQSLPTQFFDDPGAAQTIPSDMLLSAAQELLKDMQLTLAVQVYSYIIPPAYRRNGGEKDNDEFPKPSEIPSQDWSFVEDLTTEVRLWYLKDNLDQYNLAVKLKALLAGHIIAEEKKLMGRTHMRDDLNSRSIFVRIGLTRTQPNGGDGKLDIYIYNLEGANPPKAWVQVYNVDDVSGVGCSAKPSYMAVNFAWAKTADAKKVASTLAHEYFHTIQNTYNRKAACREYDKIDEGTATYIKHHIYPKYNDEHDWWEFSENGSMSLINEDYETWPFYYFMVEMNGSFSMPKLYEMMGSQRPMDAVDKVLSGGFKKQWLEYAVYEWNQEPLQDGFRQWDNYNIIPGRGTMDASGHLPPIKIEKVTLDANGQYRNDMEMHLKPLTRDFYAYDLSNANIHSISIENPIFWNGRKIKAKALVRKKGQSKFEEILWEDSQVGEYHYCLDKKDENIDLIVLVMGNFQHQSTATVYHGKPAFKVTNLGCYGYKGTLKTIWDFNESERVSHLETTATDFEVRENGMSDDQVFRNQFYAVGGKVSYNYSGSIGPCIGTKSGMLELETGKDFIGLGLAAYNVAPEAWGDYNFSVALKEPFITVTYVCPAPKPPIVGVVAVALDTSVSGKFPKHQGTSHLKGESSGNGWTTIWDFSPVKE